ncbi:MAG: ABC transporter substrate-binding protein [Lentisphaeria bacterium]|nr:ABC transporter substrate-binding protein [Lentisphaeria bacterium]
MLVGVSVQAGVDENTIPLDVEKNNLHFGFIKLTDCASLVIAKEKGFFEAEGLNVKLSAQKNWVILLDNVIKGELDGAHMLAGQPIGATVGVSQKADIITAFSMDLNGNGITLATDIWEKMKPNVPKDANGKVIHPIKSDSLKPVIESWDGDFPLGMVFPVSTHNYELRYWLAAGGIHPGFYTATDPQGHTDGDVVITPNAPPLMPSYLNSRALLGYCVGEPWNQKAVFATKDGKQLGVPVVTNYEIWKNNPEKVFGVTKEWAEKYPQTHLAVLKALIRAAKWLDASEENRVEAVKILSRSHYVGAEEKVLNNSMTGTFVFERGDRVSMPDFNVFFRYKANYPFYSDCIWFLTQMRRWGQLSQDQPDSWYLETAKKIYRPDIYMEAAALLIEEENIAEEDVPKQGFDGFRPPTGEGDFIDGKVYDGKKPNDYIGSFTIRSK